MSGRWPPLVIILAFVVDLVLVGLHVINAQGVGPAGRPLRFFDLDDEVNLPTWWSSAQLLSIGLLMSLVAARAPKPTLVVRASLWVLPAAFFLMSLDEFVQLHERLGQATRTGVLPVTGLWPLILGPLVLLVLGAALVVARGHLHDRRGVALITVGLVAFVIAAAGIDLWLNFVPLGGTQHQLQIVAEELGELLGATLMLWGAYRLAGEWIRAPGVGR